MVMRSGSRGPEALLHGERVIVRRAASDDVDLLVRWHADPDVARFWDGKTYSRAQMLARLARPHVHAYIVEAEAEPIGYLQAWFDEKAGTGGLDMFLIPSARGQGLGPDAARTLARYLLHEGGRQRITVDPYIWNEQAVRGWQKAGFRLVEECEPDAEHPYRWLLMEFSSAPLR